MFLIIRESNDKFILAQAGNVAVPGPVASGSSARLTEVVKRIVVHLVQDGDQADSESFPCELMVSTMGELKRQIAEVAEVRDESIIKVILNHSEQLVTITKLLDGGSYTVTKKVKEGIVKIYFDTRV